MAAILGGLNEAQYTAVTSPAHVLQVLAPPGSGKTKTLTSRVAWLLQHNKYKPWDVICLTFTVKSSREMKERIAKLLGNGLEKRLVLGTFHSVCRRYLVSYGHLIGVKEGFGIADSSDTTSIIKRIVKRLKLSIDPRKAQSRISSSKSKGIGYGELTRERAKRKNVDQLEFEMVFEEYQQQLERSHLLDYDDLLLRCVDLLKQYPACVSNVEVVLIDEFQDTNLVQFDLMRLFASRNKRITTVGDPDQSIYGWRSAEIKNLGRMQEQYPDTLVIHLRDNYRSSGAILLAAHEVIVQDESRPSKPLLPTHCPGTMPVLRRLASAEIEAQWIVSEIQRSTALTGCLLNHSDYAILLRQASLSRHIELALGKAGIPYKMVGGKKFYDRLEVRIILDYLRVVLQPNNNDALSRILGVPARGVGPSSAHTLLEVAEERKVSLWIHIRGVIQGYNTNQAKVSKATQQGLGTLTDIILTSRKKVLDSVKPISPEDLVRHLLKKLDFQSYIKKTHAEDHEARWANVEELVAQAADYSLHTKSPLEEDDESLPHIVEIEQQQQNNIAEEALSKFLANVALSTELQREDEEPESQGPRPQVTISTIHAAKGLEWPVVFVPCAYGGMIPHSRSEDVDEERRLLYVAMTRAQALLYLSCSKKNSQREETTLSPFLSTKPVGQYLVNQGPIVESAAINDICRILSREAPTQPQVMSSSSTLQSHFDDLYPVNGEKNVGEVEARWSKWDNNDQGLERVGKRRRTNNDEGRDPAQRDFAAVTNFTTSSVGTLTTMQSSSKFSCGGFTSATSQLRHEEEQPTHKIKTKKVKSSICHNDMLALDSRGSLMSFWGKSGRPDANGQDSFQSGLDDMDMATRGPVLEERPFQRKLFAASTTIHAQISGENGSHQPRLPLATIPHNLSSHRLPRLPDVRRPRLVDHGGSPAKKEYTFLSSSPPQHDRLLDEAEHPTELTLQAGELSALRDSKFQAGRAAMAPAKTFHSTSVNQLKSTVNLPKKTLGVRRSMNGWAARNNQGAARSKLTDAS